MILHDITLFYLILAFIALCLCLFIRLHTLKLKRSVTLKVGKTKTVANGKVYARICLYSFDKNSVGVHYIIINFEENDLYASRSVTITEIKNNEFLLYSNKGYYLECTIVSPTKVRFTLINIKDLIKKIFQDEYRRLEKKYKAI